MLIGRVQVCVTHENAYHERLRTPQTHKLMLQADAVSEANSVDQRTRLVVPTTNQYPATPTSSIRHETAKASRKECVV